MARYGAQVFPCRQWEVHVYSSEGQRSSTTALLSRRPEHCDARSLSLSPYTIYIYTVAPRVRDRVVVVLIVLFSERSCARTPRRPAILYRTVPPAAPCPCCSFDICSRGLGVRASRRVPCLVFTHTFLRLFLFGSVLRRVPCAGDRVCSNSSVRLNERKSRELTRQTTSTQTNKKEHPPAQRTDTCRVSPLLGRNETHHANGPSSGGTGAPICLPPILTPPPPCDDPPPPTYRSP